MRKFYFAPTPWADSKQVLEDYRFQTPENNGVWQDIVATTNLEEAEFLVIQDECNNKNVLNKFEPKKRLYFNREALSIHLKNQYPSSEFNRFSFWDGTGYLPTRWWYGTNVDASSQGYGGITLTYNDLTGTTRYEKTKELCCILSDKVMNEGHGLRKDFTKKFLNKYHFDLYGSVSFRNSAIPNNDKIEALKPYKYCLGFDNQDFIDDFFGTQFTDSILSWSIPIFWCGTDLSKYFPKNSFIQFDARKDTEIDRIIDIIKNDDYNSRISDLEEARDLILNKYNFWPTIKRVIDNE
jgi:hypothetical protein